MFTKRLWPFALARWQEGGRPNALIPSCRVLLTACCAFLALLGLFSDQCEQELVDSRLTPVLACDG